MKDGLIISLLSILPKNKIARFMGWNARIELPKTLHRMLIRYFVWKYKINLEECNGDIDDFDSLSEFFIRTLKPDRRTIDDTQSNLASPVDGRVHTFGKIVDGQFKQYDGQVGSVSVMLGRPENDATCQRYHNGEFIIIYLSPQDYHRVHCHDGGILNEIQYQPGQLWPVFPVATQRIPHLFDRNERLVFHIEHPSRANTNSVLSMIGAFGVGRMTTDWNPIITNTNQVQQDITVEQNIQRGAEVGRFELGSTIVLFFEPNQIKRWSITSGQKVELGECIATYCVESPS